MLLLEGNFSCYDFELLWVVIEVLSCLCKCHAFVWNGVVKHTFEF